jgi:CRISPR-associated exonuclease Cas4
MYTDDEMLMLSGIQHFAFCPRQWALIHIEQLWADNRLTVEGNIMHSTVDDPFYIRKTNDIITLRSVGLVSKELGLYGISDVIEFYNVELNDNSIKLPEYSGYWEPHPVEYKRGKEKNNHVDEVQLAAQIICLEEMYNIKIEYGWLYYGETRRRKKIGMSSELREVTKNFVKQMHLLFKVGQTPKASYTNHCDRCSLIDICIPEISKKQTVSSYLKKQFNA